MMRRRGFLGTPLALLPQSLSAASEDTRLYAYGDGIPHSPAEYAKLLGNLTATKPDTFSLGGTVEELEGRMAKLLGKEMAVWFPTGTLANHLAVRTLAGTRRRVAVQAESHLYRDTGDCAQTLSGLTLLPLAAGRASFELASLEGAWNEGQLGRVASPIGAISIESPVRRQQGAVFPYSEMVKIAAWARARQIGLHLDGARIFIESAYTGRKPAEYAALFDTVYVSMYKYFNAASGAMLAGPKALLSDLYQQRRMFGGGLPHSWPFAAVALHYLAGFEESFRRAREVSERALATLSVDSNFVIERIPNGTNVFRLRVVNVNAPVYQLRVEETGISMPAPDGSWFTLQVNPTWARITSDEIVARFRRALG